jgi:hypothetical protein
MTATTQQAGHPRWCAHDDEWCSSPRLCGDGSTEWAHAVQPFVMLKRPQGDARADVVVVRIDEVTPAGAHQATAAVVVTATGSMTAEQAREVGNALLRAADLLDEAAPAEHQAAGGTW